MTKALSDFKHYGEHRVKFIASNSLLVKILADFLLFGLYLLTLVINHKTYTNTSAILEQNYQKLSNIEL